MLLCLWTIMVLACVQSFAEGVGVYLVGSERRKFFTARLIIFASNFRWVFIFHCMSRISLNTQGNVRLIRLTSFGRRGWTLISLSVCEGRAFDARTDAFWLLDEDCICYVRFWKARYGRMLYFRWQSSQRGLPTCSRRRIGMFEDAHFYTGVCWSANSEWHVWSLHDNVISRFTLRCEIDNSCSTRLVSPPNNKGLCGCCWCPFVTIMLKLFWIRAMRKMVAVYVTSMVLRFPRLTYNISVELFICIGDPLLNSR